MKRRMLSISMLTLILASALNVAFTVKLFAQDSEATLDEATMFDQASYLNSDWQETFERKSEGQQDKTLESYNQNSRNRGDGLSFNDASEWSKFAYADGNKTRLIVGGNGESSTNYLELERIAAKHQAKIVNSVSIQGETRAIVVELLLTSVAAFVEEVRTQGTASYIEPNMKVQAQYLPNDPYWSMQWGPQKIEADWAWNTTVGTHDVLVAVADTGIYYYHEDLSANFVALGYDWVNMDGDPTDDHGHGTHCAGIIAAALNNSIGIAGLAQAQIMAEKVLDSGGYGYWDWVANGIVHAVDAGADVISMSLSGYGYSELLHDAVKYAYDSGVLVIAAAANDNTNMKAYPAGYDEVVAVAATDQYDNKASFSNWGDWIELAAPGVDIYSTVPWGYTSWSGTSMATPHVSGVAALVWSLYPEKTRDWVRLWLRYTADDLGDPGFDAYYGYGRINARKAVEQAPPAHELIAYEWTTPPYVEPGAIGIINASVLNFGENNETGVTVQLLANDTLVDSTLIDFLASGNMTTANLAWNPMVEGIYNVTLYVVPVSGETIIENNVLWEYVYVGVPVKADVLHSAGNVYSEIITNWQVLNSEWQLFGDTMVYIDYMALNKVDITYEDLAATEADVLIISCASDPYAGWEFTDSEIEAITQYVYEGHGLIVTAGTLYYGVPNNNKLAPLFGLNENIMWYSTGTDLLHLVNATHPLFANVPNPLVFPQVGTTLPYDGRWDSNELADGEYLALGHYQESAIVEHRGLVYIAPWLEVIPAYYHHHLQLLYNAITWSRYQKPQHELVVSLEAPKALKPSRSVLLNATVSNMGLSNETNVELQLLINGVVANSTTISELRVGNSYTLSYLWTPTVEGIYNMTVYAPPVFGEEDIANNVKSVRIFVSALSVALFQNYDPWGYPANQEALDRYGVPYVVFRSSDFGSVDLSAFTKVVIASDQDQAFYNGMDTYRWWFEDYVSNDGILEIHAADWGWQGGRWIGPLPGGLYWASYYGQYVTAVDPTHDLLTTPNLITEAELDNWNYAVHGYFSDYPVDAHIIIIEDSTMMPAYLEFSYGSGFIIASSQALEWAYSRQYSLILENSLLYMPAKYEHDLVATLEAPTVLEPSASVLLNATVHNRGLNNETNVELQLLINGTIANSTVISELLVGESYTLSHLWTPTEGIYNVTAYAPPMPYEEYTGNNVVTKIVRVRYVTTALISDQSQLLAITPTLDSIGINYDVYNDNSIHLYTEDLSLLLIYKAVIFYQFNRLLTPVEHSTLQSYLSSGGNLLVTGYDSIGNPDDPLLADVVRSSTVGDHTGQPDLIVVDETHPIISGPYGSFPAGYHISGLASDNDYVEADTARGAKTVAELASGRDKIIATEGIPGKVVYWNGEGNYDWTQNTDCQAMLKNTIQWMMPVEHDLAVSLEAPTHLQPGESALLNATVYNTGLNNETDVELQLLVNGTVVDSVLIPELPTEASYTLGYLWTPTIEATYNVTAYAFPVPDEEYTINNVATKTVKVHPIKGFILFDQTHGTDSITGYSIWVAELIERGYVVENHTSGPITSTVLDGYDVFVTPQAHYEYTTDELTAIQNFVFNGSGLIVIGDDNPWIYTSLTSFVGITWTSGGYGGYTSDITPHPVTEEVTNAYFAAPVSFMSVASPATDLIRDSYGYVMLAVSEMALGKVIGLADEDSITDWSIGNGNNLRLANNMIDWLTVPQYEHDLTVSLDAPPVMELGNSTVLNATVGNRGLNNETNAELYLLINGTVVGNATVPELLAGESYTINYLWTPTGTGSYNITAYASPVPEEEYTADNIVTKRTYVFFYTRLYLSHKWVGGGDPMGWHADDASWQYTLPFDFPFYGINYRTIYISSNGLITFLGTDSSYWNSVPELANRLAIAPAWDDWLTYDLCDIYIWQNSTHVGIRWYATHISSGAIANFEAILCINSIIQFNYAYNDGPVSATIGISNGAGHIIAEDVTSLNYTNTIVFTPFQQEHNYDVAVTNIVTSKTGCLPVEVVGEGRNLYINVTVQNQGDLTETFNVAVYVNATQIGSQPVTLTPAEVRTLAFTWNTVGFTKGNYMIRAVADTVPGETDTADNTRNYGYTFLTLAGDVDGDRDVDIFDIVRMGVIYGIIIPDPHYNPNCDWDGDGDIDVFDIVIAAGNYGKSW